MPSNVRASTGDKILHELYEISRRYVNAGRPERLPDEADDGFGPMAAWQMLERTENTIDSILASDNRSASDIRYALLDLAMYAVAISREIRESTP